MSKHTIYGIPNCPNCDTAKRIAHENDVEYDYVDITQDSALADKVLASAKTRSMPIVFSGSVDGGKFIGDHNAFRNMVAMSLSF